MPIDKEKISGLLQYLPGVFSDPAAETPGTPAFLGRFLLAFEQILLGLDGGEGEPQQGLDEIITHLPTLFDPERTRGDFLQWLASWAALSLRADWTLDQQRGFLAKIVPLYRGRGTKDNLAELLKIYTGLDPVITEGADSPFQIGLNSTIGVDTQIGGAVPHRFSVTVNMPEPDQSQIGRQRQIVVALIELQKPAHTTYDLTIAHDTMQIGERSTIGVDTLLGMIPTNTGGP